ncbi:MAG: hypothetical protein EA385_13605 [Salinarimonadaceae bacterium]|nr:MAG: hypothetical protein EA385_13605 [Salinarimonadaceae bacterium]
MLELVEAVLDTVTQGVGKVIDQVLDNETAGAVSRVSFVVPASRTADLVAVTVLLESPFLRPPSAGGHANDGAVDLRTESRIIDTHCLAHQHRREEHHAMPYIDLRTTAAPKQKNLS